MACRSASNPGVIAHLLKVYVHSNLKETDCERAALCCAFITQQGTIGNVLKAISDWFQLQRTVSLSASREKTFVRSWRHFPFSIAQQNGVKTLPQAPRLQWWRRCRRVTEPPLARNSSSRLFVLVSADQCCHCLWLNWLNSRLQCCARRLLCGRMLEWLTVRLRASGNVRVVVLAVGATVVVLTAAGAYFRRRRRKHREGSLEIVDDSRIPNTVVLTPYSRATGRCRHLDLRRRSACMQDKPMPEHIIREK